MDWFEQIKQTAQLEQTEQQTKQLEQTEQLKQFSKEQNKFVSIKLPYASLSGLVLPRINLSKAHLYGANLTGANLASANLTRASLAGANLTGANLTGANLTGANLSKAVLEDAHLTRANLSRANLTIANLSKAYLISADLTYADLERADLTRAYLERSALGVAKCMDANFTEADLTSADLTSADFRRAILIETVFFGANLSDANLTGANLYYANLERAQLTDTIFLGANLTGANLTSADLTSADFRRANLTDTIFLGANIEDAIFSTTITLERLAGTTGMPIFRDADVLVEVTGVGHEIHNASNKYIDKCIFIISPLVNIESFYLRFPDIVNDFIKKKLNTFINSDKFTGNKEIILPKLDQILTKLNLSEISNEKKLVIGKSIDFVLSQSPEFINFYIDSFVQDCYHAYSGPNGMSCIKGIYERFPMLIGPAALAMCPDISSCSNDTYIALIKTFELGTQLDFNSLLQEWSAKINEEPIVFPDDLQPPQKIQLIKNNLIKFIKNKYDVISIPITEDEINEKIKKFDYIYDAYIQTNTISFGGGKYSNKTKRGYKNKTKHGYKTKTKHRYKPFKKPL